MTKAFGKEVKIERLDILAVARLRATQSLVKRHRQEYDQFFAHWIKKLSDEAKGKK